MNTFFKSLFFCLLASSSLHASSGLSCCGSDDGHAGHFSDGRAPLSIMGDHTHSAGGWMFAYRHLQSSMDGLRSDDSQFSTNALFAEGYQVAPLRMEMKMEMLGVMYALSSDLTLMLMAHYHEMEMDHLKLQGSTFFSTHSQGWGDTQLMALYRLQENERQRLHLQLGLSLPTGSITEKDYLPAMMGWEKRVLPAAMQLGSGTVDLIPALTYVKRMTSFSCGVQGRAIIRLQAENSQNYRRGNLLQINGWAAYRASSFLALNAGLSYTLTGRLRGDQQGVAQSMSMGGKPTVPTALAGNYGGQRADMLAGLYLDLPAKYMPGQRVAFDVRIPVYQNLNGYQLATDWQYSIGWEFAF
jgi:hypothetical protein